MLRHRVFTYITRADQLLILEYVDGRYLQPQIPGGTINKCELPAQAALREAQEETGLTALQLISFLGSFERDLTDIGRDETIVAWFFHLQTDEITPEKWQHFECDSSEGLGPIEFSVSWVPLNNLPKLGGIDESMLAELHTSVRENAL